MFSLLRYHRYECNEKIGLRDLSTLFYKDKFEMLKWNIPHFLILLVITKLVTNPQELVKYFQNQDIYLNHKHLIEPLTSVLDKI